MKAITWLAYASMGVAALSAPAFASTLEGWSTNLDKALATAKKEKKSVLVEFTGSDWCPPCIAMRKYIFSKKEFIDAVSKKYVLVELDFPKGTPEIGEKNTPYAQKFEIEGLPTVVLLNSDGKEFSRFFAPEYPTLEGIVKHLDQAYANKDLD